MLHTIVTGTCGTAHDLYSGRDIGPPPYALHDLTRQACMRCVRQQHVHSPGHLQALLALTHPLQIVVVFVEPISTIRNCKFNDDHTHRHQKTFLD